MTTSQLQHGGGSGGGGRVICQ